MTVEEALIEFHKTYGLLVSDEPIDLSLEDDEHADTFDLRIELIEEEYSEFRDAHDNESLTALADAICDLVYVLVGTAVSYGIPFDKCFEEVHRSNMSKLDESGKPIVREDGKILKGPDFTPPNLHKIIYDS